MCACSLVLLPGTILINPSHSNLSLASRQVRRHRRSSDIVLVARSLLLLHLGPSCSRSRSRSLGRDIATMHRSFEEESRFIECVEGCEYRIKRGFVPNMNVSIWLAGSRWLSCGANQHEATRSKVASTLTRHYESCSSRSCNRAVRPLASVASCLRYASYLPRSFDRPLTIDLSQVKQIANVASLPGIVGYSMGMPDIHSGYGFAIGNVAAFDMTLDHAIVSPGGVGFDINCGVRLLRTNLSLADLAPIKEELTQSLFDHIPVGMQGGALALGSRVCVCARVCVCVDRDIRQASDPRERFRRRWPTSRWRWSSVSTGRCAKVTRGPRTRSTARSLVVCSMPTHRRSPLAPRSAVCRRFVVHASFTNRIESNRG